VNVLKGAVGHFGGGVCVDGNRNAIWWRGSCCRVNQSLTIEMDKPNAIEAIYITSHEYRK